MITYYLGSMPGHQASALQTSPKVSFFRCQSAKSLGSCRNRNSSICQPSAPGILFRLSRVEKVPGEWSPTRQLLRSKQQHLAGYRLPPVTAMLTLGANSFRVHLEPVDWEFLGRTRRMQSSEQGLCKHLKPNCDFATSVNVGFRLSRRAPTPTCPCFTK